MRYDFLIIDYMIFTAPTLVQRLSLDGYRVVYSPIFGEELDSYRAFTLCQGIDNITVDINWYSYLDKVRYIIVCDNENGGGIVDYLRGNKYKVFGAGSKEAGLELNRHYGQQIVDRYGSGIKLPKTEEFDDYDRVIKYIEENEGEYVIKFDKLRRFAETYVSKDESGRDIKELLENLKYNIKGVVPKMYLQQKLDGIEFCVGGYFNGKNFVDPLLVNFDGDEGFVVLYNFKNKKLEDIFKQFESYFYNRGYIGYVDMNFMLDNNGRLWFLEWTIRLGGGVTEILMQSLDDAGEFFMNLIDGKEFEINFIDDIKNCKYNIGAAVRSLSVADNSMKEVITPKFGELPIYKNCAFWISYPFVSDDKHIYCLPPSRPQGVNDALGFYTGLGYGFEEAVSNMKNLIDLVSIRSQQVNLEMFISEMIDRIDAIVSLESSVWKKSIKI